MGDLTEVNVVNCKSKLPSDGDDITIYKLQIVHNNNIVLDI